MIDDDVSRHAFQVAYHGATPDDHSMDVEVLGPALLAFGKLIRESNAQLNGARSSVKVLVTSDFEHKCFNIHFELVQILQKIKDLLTDDNIESATTLLRTIGLVGSAAGGVGHSLIRFLKWKNGRKIKSVRQAHGGEPGARLVVHIEGDDNVVNVTQNVFHLAENQKVLEALESALKPVEGRQADRIEFRGNDDDRATNTYDRADVGAIIKSCEAGPDTVAKENIEAKPEIVTGTLYAYGPVFDAKAQNWRFRYRRKHIYADVSETTIGADAVRRGGSFMNDRYRVRMEVTPAESDEGTPHYKILEVLDFTPAEQQASLPLKKTRRKKRG
jgi:hypothetical protein